MDVSHCLSKDGQPLHDSCLHGQTPSFMQRASWGIHSLLRHSRCRKFKLRPLRPCRHMFMRLLHPVWTGLDRGRLSLESDFPADSPNLMLQGQTRTHFKSHLSRWPVMVCTSEHYPGLFACLAQSVVLTVPHSLAALLNFQFFKSTVRTAFILTDSKIALCKPLALRPGDIT